MQNDYTFEVVKSNIIDDRSTLYHIVSDNGNYIYYDLLLFKHNNILYYDMREKTDDVINNYFYELRPLPTPDVDAFEIFDSKNRIIFSKMHYKHNSFIKYLQNNPHLLDIEQPYVLK